MTQRFPAYLKTAASVFAGVTLAVMALNYFVDPYAVFGRNRLGIYVAADRQSKPAMIRRFPYDAVLLGNSKAACVNTSELEGYRFFSATFGGARIDELYHFTRNHVPQAKLVVLALDFGTFAETFPPSEETFANRGLVYRFPYLVELGIARDSIQTISRSLRKRPQTFRPDGSFIADRWAAGKSQPNPAVLEQAFKDEAAFMEIYQLSESRLATLEKLRDLLRERGIPAVAVLNPIHERSVRTIRESKAYPHLLAWKSRIKSLFPETVDLMDSRYSAATNFFPTDPVHFIPSIGAEFLNREVLAPRKGNLNASSPAPHAPAQPDTGAR